MHGVGPETGSESTDNGSSGPWLSVGWQHGTPDPGDQSFERGAAFAAVLARTLRAAGYEPRRLQVGLGRGGKGILELHVSGEVPGMPLEDFESLARVTLNAVTLRRELADDEDLVLLVHLEETTSTGTVPVAAPPPKVESPRRFEVGDVPIARIVVGVAAGLILGVLGLPRLELSLPTLPWQVQPTLTQVSELDPVDESAPTAIPRQTSSRVLSARPTLEPAPVPTVVPTLLPTLVPTVAPTAVRSPGVLFADRFVSPLADWPNNPQYTAWFEDGAYHLFAREPGRFVAVGVPLAQPMGDGAISAQFHKVRGPGGGGYGFIIRDQGHSAELDSQSQSGRYLVLEVGDRGEVGIWQRDETRWMDVVAWHPSEAVHTENDSNLLIAYTRGNMVRFEVNGEVVAELAVDGLPTRGGVGIFVGGDLNEVALEWLRVEAL